MPEAEPNTDGAGSGGESGTAHSGLGKDKYDQWFAAGQSIERAKGR